MRCKSTYLPLVAIVVSLPVIFSGCGGQPIRGREAGALTGGALGTGLGAIIGHSTGHLGGGMAIGGAAGALAGALIGNESDNANARVADRDAELDATDREIEGNRRVLEELRSRGVDARETDRGIVANLPNVLFEFDSAHLTPAAYDKTRAIAKVLHDSKRHALVEGYTDSVGTQEYNLNLSRRRASSVASALESDGVPSSKISTRGYGESDPIASNETDSGRERNRRVEVVLQR